MSNVPASIGFEQAPQIDYNTRLLRKGIIAGTNGANKTIVLDCMVFHGNGGGPVLEAYWVSNGFRQRCVWRGPVKSVSAQRHQSRRFWRFWRF
jgi:hypothetical protein